MTRQEKIYEASLNYDIDHGINGIQGDLRAAFKAGVKWADTNGWVSVEDEPLFNKQPDGWIATEAGSCEFIAAVPYQDSKRPGLTLWWIRHCAIEDETGLCVVGDDENTPAGWDMSDVQFYQPLHKPPKAEQ